MPSPHAPFTHHLPLRPAWACRHCGKLWPCAVAKADLAIEYAGRPGLLLYYMSAQVVEFTADLAARGELPDADTLYPRFIDWVRPAMALGRAA